MTPSEATEKPAETEKERPRLHQWWSQALFEIPLEEPDKLRGAFLQKLVEEDFIPPMVMVDAFAASHVPKDAWKAKSLCTASRLSFQSFLRSGVEAFSETFFERPVEARQASWGRFKKETVDFSEEDAWLDDLKRWLPLDYAEVEGAPEDFRPWLAELAQLAVASRFKKAAVRRSFRPPTPGPSRSLSAKITVFRKTYPHWCAIDPIYMQRLEGLNAYPLNRPNAVATLTKKFTNLMQMKVGTLPRLLAGPLTIFVSGFFVHLATKDSVPPPVQTQWSAPSMLSPEVSMPPGWREETIGKDVKLEVYATIKKEGKPDEILPVRICFTGTKEASFVALTTKDVVKGSELGRLRENFGAFSTIGSDSMSLEYQVTKRTMREDGELEEIELECEFGTVLYRPAAF